MSGWRFSRPKRCLGGGYSRQGFGKSKRCLGGGFDSSKFFSWYEETFSGLLLQFVFYIAQLRIYRPPHRRTIYMYASYEGRVVAEVPRH